MNVTQGISPTTVDTTQSFPLYTEVDDPRSHTFPGNRIRYVKAGSAIAAGDALKIKTDEATLEPGVLVPTSAIQEVIVGIAHVAIASGSFGWVTVKGRVASATVGDASTGTAGAKLGSSASAGKVISLTTADSNFTSNDYQEVAALAAGIGLMALDSWDSNVTSVEVLIS